MSSDDKPSATSSSAHENDFFSDEPGPSLSGQDPVAPDEPPVVARPSGSPVASTSSDELHRGPELDADFDEDAVLGRKRGLHVGAFFLVLGCAIAGSVVGYRAFKKDDAAESTVSKASSSASAKTAATPMTSASAPEVVAATNASAPTNKAVANAPSKSGSSAGFAGSNLGAGPAVGGPNAAPVGTGELSAGEISGVVERNRPLLRRRCWQPEVDARQGMGGSARVQTSFTIGPSGAVTAASANGGEADYPGLSSCIAARIREWKFPPSGGSTPVNVPFVFAAQ